MSDYIIIGATAFLASMLTFFSGFGLGTLLSVAFLQFFPVKMAIAYTSVIHFLNNVFKVILMRRSVDRKIVILFGLTAIVGAFIGAMLLKELPDSTLFSYTMNGGTYHVRLVNMIIALLLAFFALAELMPILHFKVKRKILPFGGFLSGFFGGLSGHQGALRSSFLLKLGLTKEVFVGTGIAVSMLIDITRISTYATMVDFDHLRSNLDYLLVALLPAFAGAVFGRIFLKKITYTHLQVIVAIGIIIFAVALGAGWMSK